MLATKTRIITDQSGNFQMIIHPDDDAQLDNVPEFSPLGTIMADVLKADYDAAKDAHSILALLQPILNAKSRTAGILCQAKIDAIDLSASIAAAVDAAQIKTGEAISLGIIKVTDDRGPGAVSAAPLP